MNALTQNRGRARRTRRLLSSVIVAWLSCQAITLTLVPAILLRAVAEGDLAACACPHGADATCPMHRHQPANATRCAMQGLTTADAAMLNSLLGVVGFMRSPESSVAPTPTGRSIPLAPSSELSRFAPPDLPPPRG